MQQAASTLLLGNMPRNMRIPIDAESGPNDQFASPIRRESFDRFSNNSGQLKN
jgi:hypothetical protein